MNRIVEHIAKGIAIVGVTGIGEGGDQADGAAVGVTANVDAAGVEAVVADIRSAAADDPFLHGHEGHYRFKGGAGRITRHNGAVEQGGEAVGHQSGKVAGALAAYEQGRVVAGTADQTEDFSGGGFYGDYAAAFVLHEQLAIGLQVYVERQGNIFAGNCCGVEASSAHGPFFAAVHVYEDVARAFLATKKMFVAAFYAADAGVVAQAVIRIVFKVVFVGLGHITKNVGGQGVFVLANRTALGKKTFKQVELLLQYGVLLGRQLLVEYGRFEAGNFPAAKVVADFLKEVADLFQGQTQGLTEGQGIERCYFAGYDHEVVNRLVGHQKLAVAIVDESPGGILSELALGVALGIKLIGRVDHLQHKEADDVDQSDEHKGDVDDYGSVAVSHVLSVFIKFFFVDC